MDKKNSVLPYLDGTVRCVLLVQEVFLPPEDDTEEVDRGVLQVPNLL